VDNIPENFQLQKENGIAIKSWFNDNPTDKELQKLQTTLGLLITLDDVRVGIKKINGQLSLIKIANLRQFCE
jgi:TFIIF-interacting CTD phosphatase-like protein